MVEYIFFFMMFVIFFFRDVQLLTTGGGLTLKSRLLAYSLIQFLLVIGFVTLFPRFHGVRFTQLLTSSVVWPLCVTLHLLAGSICYVARRRSYRQTWAIALLPNPILVLSLASVGHVLPNDRMWGDPCIFATLLWIVVVCVGVLLTNRQLRDGMELAFVVDFAGVSNIAMVAVISVGLIAR